MVKGAIDAKSAANEKELEPIVFYGYETSPFCKIVRERLVNWKSRTNQKHGKRLVQKERVVEKARDVSSPLH